jgi:hypothetical protein
LLKTDAAPPQVLAQRSPVLHRLLDAEDEAFAALMLLVVRARRGVCASHHHTC